MYSIHSIGAIFNLCFIDEKNVVQINQGGNLANLIRNWATERISGYGAEGRVSILSVEVSGLSVPLSNLRLADQLPFWDLSEGRDGGLTISC